MLFATVLPARRRHRSDRKDTHMNCWVSKSRTRFPTSALLLSLVLALLLHAAPAPALAAEDSLAVTSVAAPARTHFLSLGVGKSVIIDLPRGTKDVLVA